MLNETTSGPVLNACTSSQLPLCAGLFTLQELQAIQDPDLDTLMNLNEADRLRKQLAATDEASKPKQSSTDATSKDARNAGKGRSKTVAHKTQTGILQAAGTGHLASEIPQSSLLKHLSSARYFLPTTGPHADKPGGRYAATASQESLLQCHGQPALM